ncbi:MAG TPA: bifunctional 23S rRNA (guanine(2069)-N(7))-methyltransferase RlmK/23S rRNA (guanine(2445)-N(2))-methyltransferase RlmL [Desulfuromonadales bacterium]|nr:bifunctional 23S rRNA (guanine(2069)-N(7))-methyltransferase RlmK/23S rRNA (guanine(2445)-N(2))-methyltransferase RlmL [Desulfuromonadales bacterium]
MNADTRFFATVPRRMEHLLVEELRRLAAVEIQESRSGVYFAGGLETALRVCLWSRLASRVLLPLAEFPAATPEALYAGAAAIAWEEHLAPQGTLAVDCTLTASRLNHSHYAALKVKDAVVDRFRNRCGIRPSVAVERPDLRINVHVHRDVATISLDLSGESLHRRGYREEGGAAPLKENLAAAILLKAGWLETAQKNGVLVDPMCGSGTLPIEAALMAADIAPGLLRPYFGFSGWLGNDPRLWRRLVTEAETRRLTGLARIPLIVGYDANPAAVRVAWANLERAGLAGRVHFERRDVAELSPPSAGGERGGLVVVNPPYGERLGEVEELHGLYRTLGERLKSHFSGWNAAVFTGNPELGRDLGLRARRLHTLFNGALECRLLQFEVAPEWFAALPEEHRNRTHAVAPASLGEGAEMFANRLRKNLRNLGRWARQNGITCYRLYDADLPEYAVAVDLYERWVHVQEYEAPATIDPQKAGSRLRDVLAVLPAVLEVPAESVFLKVRRRQKGTAQYQKFDRRGEFHEVHEEDCRFLVNFSDYLDTGLFLDHRPTRQLLRELAPGKHFLNLFAYTGAATVYAAAGGARATTTVDLSQVYLDWAQRNLALNGFSGAQHEFVRADCLEWLQRERRRFDLIFLDPPTFSTSKRMEATFDVQRDHVPLLRAAAGLLAPGGVLIFSNNNRRFRMDCDSLPALRIEEITRQTIPRDFERNPRIHNCWRITLRQ